MRGVFTFIILLLILVFAIVVGAQNEQLVTVNYLIAESEMQLSTLMSIMLGIGVVISMLLFSLYIMRLKWRIGQLSRDNKKLLNPDNT